MQAEKQPVAITTAAPNPSLITGFGYDDPVSLFERMVPNLPVFVRCAVF